MLSRNDLRLAFDKVDKDNSGAIDLNELGSLCSSLNHEVVQEEVVALFKEIDTNHDGKISFEEFVAWFRLGKATKLKGFLKKSLRGMAFVNEHKAKMTHTAEGEQEKLTLFNLEVSEGNPGDKTHCCVKMGNTCPELLARVSNACPSFTGKEDRRAWSVMTFRSKNATALSAALNNFLDFVKDTVSEIPGMDAIVEAMVYEVGVDGDYVVLAMDLESNFMLAEPLEMAFGVAGGIPLEAFGLEAEVSFQTDCSLKHMMTVDNIWDHSDNSGVKMSLGMNKSAKEFAMMMMQNVPDEAFGGNRGDALSVITGFNGMSLIMRANGANQNGAGSAYKTTHDALKAFNSGFQGQQALEAFESMSSQYKTYGELMNYAQTQRDEIMPGVVIDPKLKTPIIKETVMAFYEHGLWDFTNCVIFNGLSSTMHSKGEGYAELFRDMWNLVFPEDPVA